MPQLANGLGLSRTRFSGGGVAPNSSEAQQFYDRLLTPPTSEREALYNALIDGLVTAGVWAKLDALYLFSAADEATALTNLIQADYAASRLQSSGAAVFTADEGFSDGSTLKLITSNFNPTTAASPNLTQNDAMVGFWSYDAVQVNNWDINQMITSGVILTGIELYPKWSDGKSYYSVNDGVNGGPTNSGDSSGLFLAQRTASNARAIYHNDALLGSDTQASAAPVNGNIVFSCLHDTRVAIIGASLSAGERTALYDRLVACITSITGGVP
jgi:hypothetical protein